MDTFSDLAVWVEAAHDLLSLPSTWGQLGLIATGLAVAWLTGQFLQTRLQPIVEPGVMAEVKRTAVRTGFHALIPLLWWLLLLAGNAWLRHRGQPSQILQIAIPWSAP